MSVFVRGIRHGIGTALVVALLAASAACSSSATSSSAPDSLGTVAAGSGQKPGGSPASKTTAAPTTTTTLSPAQERIAVRAFLAGKGAPLFTLLKDTAVLTNLQSPSSAQCTALRTQLNTAGLTTTTLNPLLARVASRTVKDALSIAVFGRVTVVALCAAGKPVSKSILVGVWYHTLVLRNTLKPFGLTF